MTPLAALRALPQLAACSDREIAGLIRSIDQVCVRAGEVVAEKGRQCSEFVVVLEGTLRAEWGLLGPGDSLGWAAMWERGSNPSRVIAESGARLLVMSHAQFRAVKGVSTIETCGSRPLRLNPSLAS
jgi:CRP-like cAMP-binding protein